MVQDSRHPCRFLGIEVTPIKLAGLLSGISESVMRRQSFLIAGHNLHSAYLLHSDPEFRKYYEHADVILCDGAPVVWDYYLSGGREPIDRLGSTDWIPQVKNLPGVRSIFVVGSSETANNKCVNNIAKGAPGVSVRGVPGEGWDSFKAERTVQMISDLAPDMVLIGLGMPLQERFAAEVSASCAPCAIATVGGAIDQIAGTQRNAPRWLGRFGLEWFWRLSTQPKRLWRRYLIEPWLLLFARLRTIMFH